MKNTYIKIGFMAFVIITNTSTNFSLPSRVAGRLLRSVCNKQITSVAPMLLNKSATPFASVPASRKMSSKSQDSSPRLTNDKLILDIKVENRLFCENMSHLMDYCDAIYKNRNHNYSASDTEVISCDASSFVDNLYWTCIQKKNEINKSSRVKFQNNVMVSHSLEVLNTQLDCQIALINKFQSLLRCLELTGYMPGTHAFEEIDNFKNQIEEFSAYIDEDIHGHAIANGICKPHS